MRSTILLPALAVLALACARPMGAPPADPGDVAAAVRGVVDHSRDLHRAGHPAEARRSLEYARSMAGRNDAALDAVASLDAAYAIYAGDLARAAALVEGRARLAEQQRRYPAAENLMDELLFIREAQGDAAGMVACARAMARINAAAGLAPAQEKQWLLGVLWQRAHTHRVLAQTQQGAERAATLAVAAEARAAFTALARERNRSLASIAVLDESFATLDGDGPAALAAARTLKIDDLDPQDVYLTMRAFEAGGDAAAAEAARTLLREQVYPSVIHAVFSGLATGAQKSPRSR